MSASVPHESTHNPSPSLHQVALAIISQANTEQLLACPSDTLFHANLKIANAICLTSRQNLSIANAPCSTSTSNLDIGDPLCSTSIPNLSFANALCSTISPNLDIANAPCSTSTPISSNANAGYSTSTQAYVPDADALAVDDGIPCHPTFLKYLNIEVKVYFHAVMGKTAVAMEKIQRERARARKKHQDKILRCLRPANDLYGKGCELAVWKEKRGAHREASYSTFLTENNVGSWYGKHKYEHCLYVKELVDSDVGYLALVLLQDGSTTDQFKELYKFGKLRLDEIRRCKSLYTLAALTKDFLEDRLDEVFNGVLRRRQDRAKKKRKVSESESVYGPSEGESDSGSSGVETEVVPGTSLEMTYNLDTTWYSYLPNAYTNTTTLPKTAPRRHD